MQYIDFERKVTWLYHLLKMLLSVNDGFLANGGVKQL